MTLIKLYCEKGPEDSGVNFIGQASGRISGWVLAILFHTARPYHTQLLPPEIQREMGVVGGWVGVVQGWGAERAWPGLAHRSSLHWLYH